MKNLFCVAVCIAAFLSIPASLAHSETAQPKVPEDPKQTVKSSTKTKVKRDFKRPSGIGSDAYFGLLLGLTSTEPELGKTEPSRSGELFGIRASASIFSGSFGICGGLGWFSGSLKASNIDDPEFAALESADVRRQKILKSSGAFVDFFPHFRPTQELQLGPIAHIALAPYQLYLPDEDAKSQTIFGGAMAAYEIAEEERSYRFGLQYLVDINIETRSIQNFLVTAEYGIPLKERFTRVVEKKRTESRSEIVEKVVEKPVEKKVVSKQISMVFDQQLINFVTGKAELLPKSQQKLDRLAKFLMGNRLLWSQVIIEGHTDRRGTFEYNMKLSTDRAVSVGQTLTRSGVDPKLIKWQGFGPNRPIDPQDNELAWARNRRVEIKFDGVTDETALRNGVGQAMNQAQ